MNKFIKKNIKILIVGDLMLDHYIYGDCNRISPEAPVQVVDVKRDRYTLGGAGNVLQNLRSFNCDVDIISVIGDDDNGQLVIEHLEKEGSHHSLLIRDKSRCTTVKSRVMVQNHQLIRLDRESNVAISNDIAQNIIDTVEKRISKYDLVLLSDYNKGLLSDYLLSQLFAICRSAGVKTVIDPKGNNFSKYKGVNIIKPNKREAIIASGIVIKDDESLKDACVKIKELTNCDDVIITMSEDGIALFSNDEVVVIATKALDVIDVTGAGDTVLASLGLALASDNTLYDACNFANQAAAVVVSKVGSATATFDEIDRKFNL